MTALGGEEEAEIHDRGEGEDAVSPQVPDVVSPLVFIVLFHTFGLLVARQ